MAGRGSGSAVLGEGFFGRPTLEVARGLLGCVLCRAAEGGVLRWPITETEAYDGPHDRASHAFRGRTRRTAVMFGPPGIWYVYFCYGVHWMLNIVTGPENYPAAVLIRGAGEIHGPGRLTRALGVTGALNGLPAAPECGLWIEAGDSLPASEVVTTPRIGVAYAGADWAARHYRFLIKQTRAVVTTAPTRSPHRACR